MCVCVCVCRYRYIIPFSQVNNNQAFGNHLQQNGRNTSAQKSGISDIIANDGYSRPHLEPNALQIQQQKLKKPPQAVYRQASLQEQPEFTKIANTPGSNYTNDSNIAPAYTESLRSRRVSDSAFQKKARQDIVGEIER